MGIAVIFGLGFATFLTLVLVPVIFVVWEEMGDAFKSTFSFGKKKEKLPQPEPPKNEKPHIFED